MKSGNLLTLACAVYLLLASSALGGTPALINYQGLVTDSSGNPLNGDFEVVIRIYNDSVGASLLWQEVHGTVTVSDGLFNIVLGSVVPLPPEVLCDPDDDPSTMLRYLEVEVAGDGPISPRQQLVASPYSVASYRVAGDIKTDSGKIIVSDPASLEERITVDGSKPRLVVAKEVLTGRFAITDIGESSLYMRDSSSSLVSRINSRADDLGAQLSVSTGGSGGEDRLTENVTLSVVPETPGEGGSSLLELSGYSTGGSGGEDRLTENVTLSVVPESPFGSGGSTLEMNSYSLGGSGGEDRLTENVTLSVVPESISGPGGSTIQLSGVSLGGSGGEDRLTENVTLSVVPETPFGVGGSNIQLSGYALGGSGGEDRLSESVSLSVVPESPSSPGSSRVLLNSFQTGGSSGDIIPMEEVAFSVVHPEVGRGGTFGNLTSFQTGGSSGEQIPMEEIAFSVAAPTSDSAAGVRIDLVSYQTGGSSGDVIPVEQISFSVAPDTGIHGIHPGIQLSGTGGSSGDPIPTEQLSINFGATVLTPDGFRQGDIDAGSIRYFDSSSLGSDYIKITTGGGAGGSIWLGHGSSGAAHDEVPTEMISLSLTGVEPLVRIRPPGSVDGEEDGVRYEYDGLSRRVTTTMTDIDDPQRFCTLNSDGLSFYDGLLERTFSNTGISIKDNDFGVTLFEVDPLGTISNRGSCFLAQDFGQSVVIGEGPAIEKLTVLGNICATGTIGPCSDSRYKENVETIENSEEIIESLRGVEFDWNVLSYPEKNFSLKRQIGLIAQEVEKVLPSVVSRGADGYLSVDYSRIVPVLIESSKKQTAKIKTLETEVEQLTSRLNKIEELLANNSLVSKTKVAMND